VTRRRKEPVLALERVHPGGQVVATEAHVELIEELARAGHPLASIARALRIDRSCLRDLRRRQPEVDEAIARGRGALEIEVVNLLLAQGREGNTTALIWLSKNILGWRDNPVVEGTNVAVQIIVPGAESMETYLAKVGPVRELEGERPADE
jgi:hypothetical protein